MPTRRDTPRESFPGGIAATRRSVRARGGLTGVAVSLSILVVGWLARMVIGGALGGAVSFVAMVAAFPLMPVAGIPAANGTVRVALSRALDDLHEHLQGQSQLYQEIRSLLQIPARVVSLLLAFL